MSRLQCENHLERIEKCYTCKFNSNYEFVYCKTCIYNIKFEDFYEKKKIVKGGIKNDGKEMENSG